VLVQKAAKPRNRASWCRPSSMMKSGIQAIATTALDLPPEPGVHATFAQDHEYKCDRNLTLLVGINCSPEDPCPWSETSTAAVEASNAIAALRLILKDTPPKRRELCRI
jgi:hypothetical protein